MSTLIRKKGFTSDQDGRQDVTRTLEKKKNLTSTTGRQYINRTPN